jgi:hypothetical protein
MTDIQAVDSGALSINKVKFGATYAQIAEGLTYEEWQDIALCAGVMNRASHFWIGDIILYGEANYGEKYAQVMDSLGVAYSTLANIVHVCKTIPPEQRREALSFTAHQEACCLPAEEREAMLAVAEAEGLSSKEIRERVRGKLPIQDVLIACTVKVAKDVVELEVPAKVLDNFVGKYLKGATND